MYIVPSTETAVDRMAKAKKISEEIAVLTSVKGRAEIDVKSAVTAAEIALERVKSLKAELIELETTIEQVARETLEFMGFCTKLMKDESEKTIEILKKVEEVANVADKSMETIERTRKEADVIHRTIVAENKHIDQQHRDLDIYHSRLKKHFKEHLPGQEIII